MPLHSPVNSERKKSSPDKVVNSIKAIKNKSDQVSPDTPNGEKSTTTKDPPVAERSITPTSSPTAFERSKTSKGGPPLANSDLVNNIIKASRSNKSIDKSGSVNQPAEPGQAEKQPKKEQETRRPSEATHQQKVNAKAELDQLLRDLGDSGTKIGNIKSSHESQEDNKVPPPYTEQEKREMSDEVEAFKRKASQVIAVLKKLVDNFMETLRAELMEDVGMLQDCTEHMTSEQFDEYTGRIIDLVKKIDKLLGTIK